MRGGRRSVGLPGPGRRSGEGADVIVVAAGVSERMAGVDKRLALIGGRPMIIRTLEAIASADAVDRVVLVMEEGPALDRLRQDLPASVAAVVAGGDHRGASVEAGFRALEALHAGSLDPLRVVLVHDGARPLVTPELINAVAFAVAEYGAAIPVLPIVETVRRLRDGVLGEAIDRTDLVTAQTPQGALAGLFSRAFAEHPAAGPDRFTDEASLLAACTIPVHPVPGDPVNLKVTLPADLGRAQALISAATPRRVGHGADSHPFGPGEPLRLGGIEIAGAPRLHGHSDGDVALHAIADALLGAAAIGDLGRSFPADHRTPAGIDSGSLLRQVQKQLEASGWEIENIDLTITAARPRLVGRLDAMQAAIGALLGLESGAIGVKASTGNLDGSTGAGRTVAAAATVAIRQRSQRAATADRPPAAISRAPTA